MSLCHHFYKIIKSKNVGYILRWTLFGGSVTADTVTQGCFRGDEISALIMGEKTLPGEAAVLLANKKIHEFRINPVFAN